MLEFLLLIVNLPALWLILRRPAPRPFPWNWALIFLMVLTVSGFISGHVEKAVGFVTLLSAFILTRALPAPKIIPALKIVSIALTLFICADFFSLIDLPPAAMQEFYFDNLIHRPVMLTHPNVKAAWLLLMPLSGWTLAGVVMCQSRGAFLGLLAVLAFRIPPRYRLPAAALGISAALAFLALRPGTAFVRADYWLDAWRLFSARPLVGWGTGTFPSLNLLNDNVQTAHNIFATVAAENGLFGLIPLVGLLAGLGWLVYKSASPAKWSLLAFAMQQLVDDQWLAPVTALLIGINLGLLYIQVNSVDTDIN